MNSLERGPCGSKKRSAVLETADHPGALWMRNVQASGQIRIKSDPPTHAAKAALAGRDLFQAHFFMNRMPRVFSPQWLVMEHPARTSMTSSKARYFFM